MPRMTVGELVRRLQEDGVGMTDEQKEDQRRSFAHGNAAISNPNITREMVNEAAKKIDRERAGRMN